ncbi:50S ribosomal protein L35 [Patescibacteria group bacterium]|nr:50S ribosomal protein L35 [Patescibacteria group bacterium]MBU1868129.1 50S ribosomal protein L35 [Patescibacteria group bacterium]
MMKLKTHKGLKKRIKTTNGGKGKYLRGHVRSSHLKTKQSSKAKRQKRKLTEVSKADRKRVESLLPYK